LSLTPQTNKLECLLLVSLFSIQGKSLDEWSNYLLTRTYYKRPQKGRLVALHKNVGLTRNKHSSLFVKSVSDKDKKAL
jgi:hypothetical protein